MKVKNLSMYGSHIPVLCTMLSATKGPVLDLGMGLSTIVMDMMCKEEKRPIVSYETDKEWYEANKIYRSDFHKIIHIPDWDSADIEGTHWSLALVDHAPAKRRRIEIKRLASKANFVLVHDTEPESDKYFKYSWVYKYYKYRFDYKLCRPNTTVLSNYFDLKFLENYK